MTDTAAPRAPAAGEWLAIVAAALVLVVASPQVFSAYWSPKVAVELCVLVPGLLALGWAARAGDRAAFAGVSVVGVALVATVLSPSPKLAFIGLYNQGTGWLYVALVMGMWALGRRGSDTGADRLVQVIVGAAALNAIVSWLQSAEVGTGVLFDLVDGRPPGLLGNPVHSTALFLGTFALVLAYWRPAPKHGTPRIPDRWIYGFVGLLSSAIELAGGRLGLVVLVALAAIALIRVDLRRGVPFVLAVVIGIGAGALAAPAGTGAASRVGGSGASAFDGRLDRWRLAPPAIEDRPVIGIGPGLYRRATSPYSTKASARAFGADSLSADAHNVFVEYAVTTGILGLAALLAWLVAAGRGARGGLAWFVVGGGISLLLQPQSIALTPVLALALGFANRTPQSRVPPPVRRTAVAVSLGGGVLALVLAVTLLRGDALMLETVTDLDPIVGRDAASTLAVWPQSARQEARAYSYRAIAERRAADWPRALRAARTAWTRDPSDPAAANFLGSLELAHGSVPRADEAFATALRWNPYSLVALEGRAAVAARRDDATARRRWCTRVHELAPTRKC